MNSNAASSGTYSFNDIHVDVDGMKVTRAGLEIALEPKAHALLSVLLTRPGHAFTHQELLDAVWGHRHVTPGVLVRLIGLLRRALGDEDSHELYIQTIHGVGYRFNLPAPTDGSEPELPIDIAANDPAPAIVEVIDDDLALKGVQVSSPRYNRQFLQLAVLFFVLLTLWALLYIRRTNETVQATTSVDTVPVLAVMPLRALDKDQRSAAMAESISENIVSLLSRTQGVRVIASNTSSNPMNQKLDNAEMAKQLHATHYLEGTIEHKQQRVFLNFRLVIPETSRTVWAQSHERVADEGFLLQRQIAVTTGKQLRQALQLVVVPKNEDPILYKRYYWALFGFVESTKANVSAPENAERELRQLTKEHPDYARGWGGLAHVLAMSSSNVHDNRELQREQSIDAAKKALTLNPDQADAHSALAAFACRDQHWNECLLLSEKSVRLEPSNSVLIAYHARRLLTVGYVRQALKIIDDALLTDPLCSPLTFFRGRALDTLGRHDEARDQLLSNDMPHHTVTALYMNSLWRKDFESAERIANDLPLDHRWRDSEILLAQAHDDPTKWPMLERSMELSEAEVDIAKPFRPYSLERLFLPKRDYARDIAGLNAMQVMGYTTYQWVLWQPESRELRASDAFRQYIDRTGLKAYWKKHTPPDFCMMDKVKEANCE